MINNLVTIMNCIVTKYYLVTFTNSNSDDLQIWSLLLIILVTIYTLVTITNSISDDL